MTERAAALAPISAGARRTRRLSLLALPFVVAVALVVHSWETALEWWRVSDLVERRVEAGQSASYAGADWRLLRSTRVVDRPDGSAVVLVEFEAVIRDPDAFARLPCTIALADAEGRRWLPSFMRPRELRGLQRNVAIPETCGSVSLTRPQAGTRVEIAESFVLPKESLAEAQPMVSLAAGRPYFLRFEELGVGE
jgi:hypothetical protein